MNGPDGQRFPWGKIREIHQIGDFQIVEYIPKGGGTVGAGHLPYPLGGVSGILILGHRQAAWEGVEDRCFGPRIKSLTKSA